MGVWAQLCPCCMAGTIWTPPSQSGWENENDFRHIKCFRQCLACCKCSVNISCNYQQLGKWFILGNGGGVQGWEDGQGFCFLKLILDAMKCALQKVKRLLWWQMITGQGMGHHVQWLRKVPACVMVTSEPRPEGYMGHLSVLMSEVGRLAPQSSLQADSCSKVSIHFKAHSTWRYILILLYPCLCVSQAPAVMQPWLTSNLTRH